MRLPGFRHGSGASHGTLELEGRRHGTAGAVTSDMTSIASTLIYQASGGVRRVYWRAIWRLGAGCLRAWLLAT
jgi:hypothetical protein